MSKDLKLHDKCYISMIIITTIYVLIVICLGILSSILDINVGDNILLFLGTLIILFDCIMLFVLIKSKFSLRRGKSLVLGLSIPLVLYCLDSQSTIFNIMLVCMIGINLILSLKRIK